jgi:hypothetical protein
VPKIRTYEATSKDENQNGPSYVRKSRHEDEDFDPANSDGDSEDRPRHEDADRENRQRAIPTPHDAEAEPTVHIKTKEMRVKPTTSRDKSTTSKLIGKAPKQQIKKQTSSEDASSEMETAPHTTQTTSRTSAKPTQASSNQTKSSAAAQSVQGKKKPTNIIVEDERKTILRIADHKLASKDAPERYFVFIKEEPKPRWVNANAMRKEFNNCWSAIDAYQNTNL